jgi:hypothetical protein
MEVRDLIEKLRPTTLAPYVLPILDNDITDRPSLRLNSLVIPRLLNILIVQISLDNQTSEA